MGEIADMMLEGTLCAGCGEYLGNGIGDGVPCYCARCQRLMAQHDPAKAKCPECGRKVKAIGLDQHIRDVHGKRSTP